MSISASVTRSAQPDRNRCSQASPIAFLRKPPFAVPQHVPKRNSAGDVLVRSIGSQSVALAVRLEDRVNIREAAAHVLVRPEGAADW